MSLNGPLVHEGENDYVLKEDDEDGKVWVTVRNLSVYIARCDDGVSVDIYPLYREADTAIAGTYALYTEAEEDQCDT